MWLALERVICFAISFFGGIILARILTPSDFGAVAFSTSFFLIAGRLSAIGISQEIIRAKDDEHLPLILDTYFWLNALLVTIIFLAVNSIAFTTSIFSETGRWITLIISAGWSFNNLFEPCRNILQKNLRFKALSILQWLPGISGMLTAVLMAYNGYGVWSLCIPQMVFLALAGLASFIISGYLPKFRFNKIDAKTLLKKSPWYLGSGFSEGAYQKVDDLAIGQFLGSAALGFYDRAYMLGGLFHHNAGTVITRIILPLFAARADDKENLAILYGRVARLVLYSATFAIMLFYLYCPLIINTLWGEKWLPAVAVFRALAPYSILLPVFYITKDVLISLGEVKKTTFAYLWVLLSIILLIYPAMHYFKLSGAAVVVDLALVIGLVSMLYSLKKALPTLYIYQSFFQPLLIAACLAVGIIALHNATLIENSIIAIIFIVTVWSAAFTILFFSVEKDVGRFTLLALSDAPVIGRLLKRITRKNQEQ